MADFVDFMEGTKLKISENDDRMEEFWQSDEWLLEQVPIGRRVQCLITNEGKVKFSGKSKIENKVPQIIQDINELGFPKDTLLDGYLTAGDYARTVQMIEYDDSKSVKEQKASGALRFILTDLIMLKDRDIYNFPLFDRMKALSDFCSVSSYVEVSQKYRKSKKELYEQLKGTCEVFIFKLLNSPYIFGTSGYWKILKVKKPYFVVILDITEGKGKYKGACGSLEVGQYKNEKLVRFTSVGMGMDMDTRINFLKDKNNFINKVIEIRALNRTKKSFNEAIFYSLRNDLNPKNCIYSEEAENV
jgi:ATP-dependent DNA ligase